MGNIGSCPLADDAAGVAGAATGEVGAADKAESKCLLAPVFEEIESIVLLLLGLSSVLSLHEMTDSALGLRDVIGGEIMEAWLGLDLDCESVLSSR